MTCERCRRPMRARRSTAHAPYRYLESGLRGVDLIGVTISTCPACGEEVVSIPKLGQLHQAIAGALLTKPGALAGDEIRFLRKNAGIAASRFAELLGIDPAHLSRAEHGKRELGAPTERLARAVIAAAMKRADIPAILLAPAAKSKRARERLPMFVMRGDAWRQAA